MVEIIVHPTSLLVQADRSLVLIVLFFDWANAGELNRGPNQWRLRASTGCLPLHHLVGTDIIERAAAFLDILDSVIIELLLLIEFFNNLFDLFLKLFLKFFLVVLIRVIGKTVCGHFVRVRLGRGEACRFNWLALIRDTLFLQEKLVRLVLDFLVLDPVRLGQFF
jgi:hypothetical protein